jgi:hypothetical protein
MGFESFSGSDDEEDDETRSQDQDIDVEGSGDGEDDELFADARAGRSSVSRSPSTSPDLELVHSKGKGKLVSSPWADDGEPTTPGPGKHLFPSAHADAPVLKTSISPADDDELDDDWEVPGPPTPANGSPALSAASSTGPEMPGGLRIVASRSARGSRERLEAPPQMVRQSSGGSTRTTGSTKTSASGKKKSRTKEASSSYPFPSAASVEQDRQEATVSDEGWDGEGRERRETETPANQPRRGSAGAGGGEESQSRTSKMRSATAKDGGRTRSGGVKGLVQEDA